MTGAAARLLGDTPIPALAAALARLADPDAETVAALPARFSVSLNIVEGAAAEPWRDQYRFDPAGGTIVETLNVTAIEGLLPLAAHLGGPDGLGLPAEIAARHPVDRIRFGLIRALVGTAPDEDGRLAVLETAAGRDDAYLGPRARVALAAAERHARWAASPP